MIRLAAAAFAFVAVPAVAAIAQTDPGRLSTQYSTWAGSKSNADSLVSGLQNGSTVMLVTQGPNNTRNLAGFTPPARMSPEEVATALSKARTSLARIGIHRPSADQIQAALIGGDVTLADGRTRAIQGSVTPLPDTVAVR